MTSPSTRVPAGWYRDPSDPSMERYWDGTAWDGYLRPAGAEATEADQPASPHRARTTRTAVAVVVGAVALGLFLNTVVWGAM